MSIFSYDADDFIRQLREITAQSLAVARSTIDDKDVLAGIEAQAALLPARECFARFHIGMREAGRDYNMIAAVAGAFAGAILSEIRMNAPDPELATDIFGANLERGIAGTHEINSTVISARARPAGRA
ncbi:MAG: hypothetical protein ACK4GW_13550 [Pseudorhodobacter sp.]